VNRNGKHLAAGTVTHYFHVAGKLYVVVAVEHPVEWLKLVPGNSLIAIYDDDFIVFVDEDDEPI